MKLNYLIFLVVILFSCDLWAKEFYYVGLVDKMTTEFIKTKGKELQVYLTGSGGAMMNDVKKIGMYFTAYRSMTIESARVLHINLVESYLKLVNANEELRPYLHNYPFDFRNIHINTGFEDQNLGFQKEGIACVYHKQESGLIYYYIYDTETKKLQMIFEEPYETAYKIVKETGALDSKPSDMVTKTPQRPLMPFEKKLLNTK